MAEHDRRNTRKKTAAKTPDEAPGDLTAQEPAAQVPTPTRRQGDHPSQALPISPMGRRAPLYQRIADDLRERIESGELAPGTKLPSESVMAAQYEVSVKTVRDAMKRLQSAGLVETEHGRGTKVLRLQGFASEHVLTLDPAITRTAQGFSTWDDHGWTPVHGETHYRDSAAHYHRLLGIKPASDVLILRRHLEHTSGVQAISRVFVPGDVAADIMLENPFQPPAGLYQAFTEAGHELHWCEITASAMPSPDDALTLDIPDGVPLLIHIRITLGPHEMPLALEEIRLPAHLGTFTHQRPSLNSTR